MHVLNLEQNRPKCSNNVDLKADQGILTQRQKEVLELLSSGLQNKEIAYLLQIKEATIKLHIGGLMRRLGARNRTMAVIRAQKIGLLPSKCLGLGFDQS